MARQRDSRGQGLDISVQRYVIFIASYFVNVDMVDIGKQVTSGKQDTSGKQPKKKKDFAFHF